MKKIVKNGPFFFISLFMCSFCFAAEQQGRTALPDKVQPKVSLKAKAFDLSQVILLDGPFKDAMERNRKYLLQLDADRLLHTFRINAGLPSTAKPYGGWEGPGVELRGHSIGHYLSGCAMMYSATGDAGTQTQGGLYCSGTCKMPEGLRHDRILKRLSGGIYRPCYCRQAGMGAVVHPA